MLDTILIVGGIIIGIVIGVLVFAAAINNTIGRGLGW